MNFLPGPGFISYCIRRFMLAGFLVDLLLTSTLPKDPTASLRRAFCYSWFKGPVIVQISVPKTQPQLG